MTHLSIVRSPDEPVHVRLAERRQGPEHWAKVHIQGDRAKPIFLPLPSLFERLARR